MYWKKTSLGGASTEAVLEVAVIFVSFDETSLPVNGVTSGVEVT